MKNWYIVQTFSGFEHKVAETLKETIKAKELKEKINEILVPIHEVTEVKRGKRVQRKKKILPKLCSSKNGNEQRTLSYD